MNSVLNKLFPKRALRKARKEEAYREFQRTYGDVVQKFRVKEANMVPLQDMRSFPTNERIKLDEGVYTRKIFDDDGRILIFFSEFEDGATLERHFHDGQEHVHVLHGDLVDLETNKVLSHGDTLFIDGYEIHQVKAGADSQYIVIFKKCE